MSAKKIFIQLIVSSIFLSSCSLFQGSGGKSTVQVTPPPQPSAGTATVVGQIVELETDKPLANVIVRLADVIREEEGGVFILNHYSSPGTRTDPQGFFIFSDLNPGEYVMVVGDGENSNDYDIIEDEDTGNAKVWNAPPDEISDWGKIQAIVMFR